MKKANKYIYYRVLQGFYSYGWEDLCCYNTSSPDYRRELKEDLKAYRENEGGCYRVISRRELNQD